MSLGISYTKSVFSFGASGSEYRILEWDLADDLDRYPFLCDKATILALFLSPDIESLV